MPEAWVSYESISLGTAGSIAGFLLVSANKQNLEGNSLLQRVSEQNVCILNTYFEVHFVVGYY